MVRRILEGGRKQQALGFNHGRLSPRHLDATLELTTIEEGGSRGRLIEDETWLGMDVNGVVACLGIHEKGVPEEIEGEIGASEEEESDLGSPCEGEGPFKGIGGGGSGLGLRIEAEEGEEADDDGEEQHQLQPQPEVLSDRRRRPLFHRRHYPRYPRRHNLGERERIG